MSKLISKIVVPDSSEATGYSLYNVKDSGAIHSSDVGVAGGVASLDNAGKVPSSQLPSYVDDVVEGYYHENKFYTTYTPGQEEGDPGTYSGEITAETGKIYVDIPTNQSYRWSGSAYIVISSPYVLPTASANTLGGVKVGNNLSIDQNGVLSADSKTNAENGNGIGTCSTSSGTALAVTLSGYELVQNGFVVVTFEHDVPASATLNINGKGAKPIIYKGAAIEADVIKADDTVTFAYDGTNYVVTSLGGGGGSSTYPEFVTISLAQSGGSDSALIGATVVVTDDDISETILSTIWNGSDIAIQVNDGVNYTVNVGNVNDYYIEQNSLSYTAVSGIIRVANFLYLGHVVDLGLPSGNLWCTHNVGASTPDDYGLYFSWGNTVGHAKGSGYSFDRNNYNNTKGASLNGNITDAYDAATANMGTSWRMPIKEEFTELRDNTDRENATINGVAGIKYKKKSDSDVFIFFPKSGRYYGNSTLDGEGSYPECWTASFNTSSIGYYFSAIDGIGANYDRCVGLPIRAIMK